MWGVRLRRGSSSCPPRSPPGRSGGPVRPSAPHGPQVRNNHRHPPPQVKARASRFRTRVKEREGRSQRPIGTDRWKRDGIDPHHNLSLCSRRQDGVCGQTERAPVPRLQTELLQCHSHHSHPPGYYLRGDRDRRAEREAWLGSPGTNGDLSRLLPVEPGSMLNCLSYRQPR